MAETKLIGRSLPFISGGPGLIHAANEGVAVGDGPENDDEAAQTIPGLVVYRFYGPLIFANVRFFIERLEHFIACETQPVHRVIIDARAIPEFNVTAAERLRTFVLRLRERGIGLVIAKAHLPLREAAHRLGLPDAFAEENYFPKLSDAVKAYEQHATQEGPKSDG